MIDFINDIINGDIAEMVGEDLYPPMVAAVAAAWAILSFGGAVQVFTNLFAAIYNIRSGRKL